MRAVLPHPLSGPFQTSLLPVEESLEGKTPFIPRLLSLILWMSAKRPQGTGA